MFNFFKNRKLKKQNLIKNINMYLQKYNAQRHATIGLSRKNYNLLTGNYFDMIGCSFKTKSLNIDAVCIVSYSFYEYCHQYSSKCKNIVQSIKNKDNFIIIYALYNHEKCEILTDEEFAIKEIIE